MDAWEYSYVRREVLALTGIDLNGYKSSQMQGRLSSYLFRSGHLTWVHLFRTMRADPRLLEQFRATLLINGSAFLRDPASYAELRSQVLPELLRQRPFLLAWSAGCSHGQEAYSLALAIQAAASQGARYRILATDIDQTALDMAQRGGPYPAADLTHVEAAERQRYFRLANEHYWVAPQLKANITFRHHNMLQEPMAGQFDLIVCRNVAAAFTAGAKEQLHRRLHQALRPGGVLFADSELVRPSIPGFEAAGPSFYRKLESPALASGAMA